MMLLTLLQALHKVQFLIVLHFLDNERNNEIIRRDIYFFVVAYYMQNLLEFLHDQSTISIHFGNL